MELTRLQILTAYYFVGLRVLQGRLRPANRRMALVRREFYENIWRDAARAAAARFKPSHDGTAEIERDHRSITVCGNKTSLESQLSSKLASDKPTVHSLHDQAGVPTPDYIVVRLGEFDRALRMLRSSEAALVVKPAADTGGGAGVSTNVRSVSQLRAAIAWARAFGPRILVEKQIEGDCYRVLLMDGEVLDAVIRHPPTIVGDGVSTVRELLRRENELRTEVGIARAQTLIRIDSDLRNTLMSQGLTLESRPAKAQVIALKHVINENRSVENIPAGNRLCSSILECARTAANALGVRLAGVDILCRDPSVPLKRSGGAVIEVNTAPGLYWHYHNAARCFPVADRVLMKFFDTAANHFEHLQEPKVSSGSQV